MKLANAILAFFCGVIIISVVFKYLWSYLVVRLFPKAVEESLITREISWKISIILAILFLLFK